MEEQKPNCATMQTTLRLERIKEIKKILKSIDKKIPDKEVYLMISSKYGLSNRTSSEYVRTARYQMAQ